MVSHYACLTRVLCFLLRTIALALRESPDCPSLRASDEHILIVRVPRARRMVWWLPIPPFQARSLSLQGWGLIDLPLRATFSPAHPLARRDVPLARSEALPISLYLSLREWPKLPLHCAHRTSTASDRARSARQEGTWPLPARPSPARCASTEDHQSSHPLLCSVSTGD